MSNKPTKPYSYRFPTKLRDKLEVIAKSDDRDLSYMVSKAIAEFIERREAKAETK